MSEIEIDEEDVENLKELAESIKQKHGIKNITIHYEDLPKQYWYIETKKRRRFSTNGL